MVSQGASSTGAPRSPPVIAISSTPSGARKPAPMISLGSAPMLSALARADDARHHRHVVADDVVKEERGLCLVDQGGDVPDVDRLAQVDELAVAAQAVEELAETFLHGGLRARTQSFRGPKPASRA